MSNSTADCPSQLGQFPGRPTPRLSDCFVENLAQLAGTSNFAWLQGFIHQLAPTGVAGLLLASLAVRCPQSSPAGGQGRKPIIEADLVDCIVSLAGQLFYSTQIPCASGFSRRTDASAK